MPTNERRYQRISSQDIIVRKKKQHKTTLYTYFPNDKRIHCIKSFPFVAQTFSFHRHVLLLRHKHTKQRPFIYISTTSLSSVLVTEGLALSSLNTPTSPGGKKSATDYTRTMWTCKNIIQVTTSNEHNRKPI